MTRVYVGNLPPGLRDYELKDIFYRYYPGHIDMKNGFGFIEFENLRDAEDSIHDLNGYRVSGYRLIVEVAKGPRRDRNDRDGRDRYNNNDRDRNMNSRRSDRGSNNNRQNSGNGYRVEVEGLDDRASWQDLKDFARQAGRVVFADVWTDSNGKKVGVIEYGSRDDLDTAMRKLHETQLRNETIRLYPIKSISGGSGRRERSPSPRRSSSPRRDHSPRRDSPDRANGSPRRERSPSPRNNGSSRSRSRSRSPVARND